MNTLLLIGSMQEVYFSSNILGMYRIVLKNLSVQSMHTIKSADHWLHGLCHRIELHIHFRWRWWRPRRRRLFGGKDSHRAYLQRVYTIYNSVCAIAFGLNRWKDSLWMIFDRKTSDEFVVQNFDYFPKKKNSNHFYFLEILSSLPFSIAHFWRIRYFLAHSTFLIGWMMQKWKHMFRRHIFTPQKCRFYSKNCQ